MSVHDSTGAVSFASSPCAVESFGVVRVPVDELNGLRKSPGPPLARKIAPSLLKHADSQTLLGLSAVLDAIARAGWGDRSFEDWGVVAAPRFLGRFVLAAAIERFQQMGPLSVSPLLTATLSLHAVAGSLSLALKAHGLHYGVGGGCGHVAEGLMAALAAGQERGVAGVWLVATGFSPEPIPDTAGQSTTDSTGYAVALALNPHATASAARLNLRIVPAAPLERGGSDPVERDSNGCLAMSDLVGLAEFLAPVRAVTPAPSARQRGWYLPLSSGGALALEDDAARGRDAGDGDRLAACAG
ncbi:MAG: hypothetical protein U0794_10855 [Isosphaeraceae bacterium]